MYVYITSICLTACHTNTRVHTKSVVVEYLSSDPILVHAGIVVYKPMFTCDMTRFLTICPSFQWPSSWDSTASISSLLQPCFLCLGVSSDFSLSSDVSFVSPSTFSSDPASDSCSKTYTLDSYKGFLKNDLILWKTNVRILLWIILGSFSL